MATSSRRMALQSHNPPKSKRRLPPNGGDGRCESTSSKRVGNQRVHIPVAHLELMKIHYPQYYIEPKEKTVKDMDVEEYASYLDLVPVKQSARAKSWPKRRAVDNLRKSDAIEWPFSSDLGMATNRRIPGCMITRETRNKLIQQYDAICCEGNQIAASVEVVEPAVETFTSPQVMVYDDRDRSPASNTDSDKENWARVAFSGDFAPSPLVHAPPLRPMFYVYDR